MKDTGLRQRSKTQKMELPPKRTPAVHMSSHEISATVNFGVALSKCWNYFGNNIALRQAIESGTPEEIEEAILNGASVQGTIFSKDPLLVAFEWRNEEAVKILLAYGANFTKLLPMLYKEDRQLYWAANIMLKNVVEKEAQANKPTPSMTPGFEISKKQVQDEIDESEYVILRDASEKKPDEEIVEPRRENERTNHIKPNSLC